MGKIRKSGFPLGAQNCETIRKKRGFTFFAFLPPYLGVSDSLAYPIGKNFSRSIDWYKKLLISCLVARYSAVFVLRSMEVGVCMRIVLSARSFV